ncbi:MAG TPA: DNA repair protein RadC [Dehalococcoidia bacterium]|nr:DNA repair protein RadC [Dehalococcoidia bacterium]
MNDGTYPGPAAETGERTATLIRDLPATDRPRERLRDAGAGALSSAELLAILLRTGTANQSALDIANALLRDFQGLPGLARAGFADLCARRGLGEAKAAQLRAAIELGFRIAAATPEGRARVASPEDVADLLLGELSALDHESVRVVLLDARGRIMGKHETYKGSVHAAHVRMAELLRDAVRANAPRMILLHNHPSGDPQPSADDIRMTRGLAEAAKLMDIELLDHLVVGGGTYVSMRRLRLGFPADGR